MRSGTGEGGHWVFAYGSLMWRPDFAFVERQKARLAGYHRSLCIYSHHYRGPPDKPGRVLGREGGGSCVGIAFRVAPEAWPATLEALRERELVSGVYHEMSLKALLAGGSSVSATAYVADRSHRQYAGKLERRAMVERVRHCSGSAGTNIDYVRNTHLHLRAIGIADPHLGWIVDAVDAAAGGG